MEEKQYILLNLTAEKNSLLEELLDNKILKDVPFGTKYKKENLEYNYILIPFIRTSTFISGSEKVINTNGFDEEDELIKTIGVKFIDAITYQIRIKVINVISEDQIDIFYTDGSFSSKSKKSAWAVCKLLEQDELGLFDEFTGKKFLFESYDGKINNGTNNIGELTAIKEALLNHGNKKYQLIISDSIYSIKTYREFIHVWKENGYRAYNGKPIKNKELILEIFDILKELQNQQIVLFTWTKGHNQNDFNDKCDQLAKKYTVI